MTTIPELTNLIELHGIKKITHSFSVQLNTLIQGAQNVPEEKRKKIYDEYVRVSEIVNLLAVIQGAPNIGQVTYKYFFSFED